MYEYFIDIHTHIEDGQTIAISCPEGISYLKTFGIHPMDIHNGDIYALKEYIYKGEIAAIGESGLDRRSIYPMDMQKRIFEEQITLSEKYEIPIIIHCVKSFSDLLHLHKKIAPRQIWIIHGFNNNKTILDELLRRENIFISLGSALLNYESNAYKYISEIPLERIFLETDDKDIDISDIYNAASSRLAIETKVLKLALVNNFMSTFAKYSLEK